MRDSSEQDRNQNIVIIFQRQNFNQHSADSDAQGYASATQDAKRGNKNRRKAYEASGASLSASKRYMQVAPNFSGKARKPVSECQREDSHRGRFRLPQKRGQHDSAHKGQRTKDEFSLVSLARGHVDYIRNYRNRNSSQRQCLTKRIAYSRQNQKSNRRAIKMGEQERHKCRAKMYRLAEDFLVKNDELLFQQKADVRTKYFHCVSPFSPSSKRGISV